MPAPSRREIGRLLQEVQSTDVRGLPGSNGGARPVRGLRRYADLFPLFGHSGRDEDSDRTVRLLRARGLHAPQC